MNHTAGSRNDLSLHVSDPPLHVRSSSRLSVKLSLYTSSTESRENPTPMPTDRWWETSVDFFRSELLPGNYLKSYCTPVYCGFLSRGILKTRTWQID